MAKGKHKPPSRVRYEQSHPTVSFRLPRDVYVLLKQRLDDLEMSFAGFVKESLGLQQAKMHDIEEIRDSAWDGGHAQALEEYQIWYYCAVCRKRINMEPNSDSHKAMIRFMRERRWGHASCVD